MTAPGSGAAGRVVGIYVGAVRSAPLTSVPEVRAVAGKGLEGDRYAEAAGSFSDRPGTGRQLTLIESEAIEAARRDYGVDLGDGGPRRNIVTAGVALNHLVGREFQVGDVRLRGVRLNEPCAHLASLTSPRVQRALVHRGGLRADILTDGVLRVGDEVRV